MDSWLQRRTIEEVGALGQFLPLAVPGRWHSHTLQKHSLNSARSRTFFPGGAVLVFSAFICESRILGSLGFPHTFSHPLASVFEKVPSSQNAFTQVSLSLLISFVVCPFDSCSPVHSHEKQLLSVRPICVAPDPSQSLLNRAQCSICITANGLWLSLIGQQSRLPIIKRTSRNGWD